MDPKPEVILTFPDSRQSSGFTCGAAATQAVLYYYGVDHREDELAEAMGSTSDTGTPPGNIVRALLGIGLKVTAGRMTVEEVKKYLDKGVPVITPIQAWGPNWESGEKTDYTGNNEEGHYVVAIGYGDGHIFYDDPGLMNNRGFIPEEDLETRWHDTDAKGHFLEHFGIAAYGREPSFNPKKNMLILASSRIARRWLAERI